MNTKTLLVIGGIVLVYLIWVRPKAKMEIGAVDRTQKTLNEGLALAEKTAGSVVNFFS